ncbi:hypothetical protein VM1G_11390 [Cytospora mali]|uniref:Uncharacterized protein n=1 Tax=Cytospora mali TaxID=578113 RepID=A0A194VRE4_CYTMA|nr:hypothetical protein VM1G_11390 [Valsa mali]
MLVATRSRKPYQGLGRYREAGSSRNALQGLGSATLIVLILFRKPPELSVPKKLETASDAARCYEKDRQLPIRSRSAFKQGLGSDCRGQLER